MLRKHKGTTNNTIMKLSSYTIAKNCTDFADVEAGIAEVKQYLRTAVKPCKTAYQRLAKLEEKRGSLMPHTCKWVEA